MLYIKYSIYTNKGRKLKFPALSFFLKKVNSFEEIGESDYPTENRTGTLSSSFVILK